MKTGTIIYVAGGKPEGCKSDAMEIIKKMEPESDRIEIISPDSGHFDISDAWWLLISKGMHRIICKSARYTEAGNIQFTGHELRLCG